MIAFHAEGGMQFMVPLTLMLIANIVLIGLELVARAKQPDYDFKRRTLIWHIALFALVWGVFSTLIAFFYAFRDLSSSGDSIPFNVIMGGLKVALITALYGMVVFLISLGGIMLLRGLKRS